jgi:hypothetical protein
LASKDLDRLLALLPTAEHKEAVPLFDKVIKDPGTAGPILLELVDSASNHDDPQLHTPHGLMTMVAGRDLLRLTRPPGGLGLLRFLVLYNFTLHRRPFSEPAAAAMARSVPPATPEELAEAYRKAVAGGLGEQAACVIGRLAADAGFEAASHLALRTSLGDLGRLGHNLVTAAASVDAAESVGRGRDLVPFMNLARLQAFSLQGVKAPDIPELDDAGRGEPDVGQLGDLVVEGSFDQVEPVLRALAFSGEAEEAYRPLLIATSADPGFLGHSLSLVHAARRASRFLTPSENTWLSWKLYRILTTRFGYPEFLALGRPEAIDRSTLLAALESSLRDRSPPVERTLRQALENDIPLDELLATVVDFYGNWTVGEKEHTISYLNAALQTAKFLGRDQALLPLTIALGKLPF